MELLRRAERDALTAAAGAALQEQRDEVKAMNQMLSYAKCAAIRCVYNAFGILTCCDVDATTGCQAACCPAQSLLQMQSQLCKRTHRQAAWHQAALL